MTDPLLSIFVHYASLIALACSVALFIFYRKEKSIYSIIIAATIGGVHSLVLMLGNYEVVNYIPTALMPTNLIGGTLVAMLLCYFPMALADPGLLSPRKILVIIVPCIAQMLLLRLAPKAGMVYRTLPSIEEVMQHIDEPNVWIRLTALSVPYLFYILPLVYITLKAHRTNENKDILLFCCVAFSVMGLFFIYSNLLNPQLGRAVNAIYSTTIFVSLTLFLYIRTRKNKKKDTTTDILHPPLPRTYDRGKSNGENYGNSNSKHSICRPAEKPSNLAERLQSVMDNGKPYLDSELTLPQLATLTGTNRTTLSALLRSQGYENFSNYLNTYRISEACRMMDNGFEGKLAELYLNVGFTNKNTFIRNFSYITGITPGQYMKQKTSNLSENTGE